MKKITIEELEKMSLKELLSKLVATNCRTYVHEGSSVAHTIDEEEIEKEYSLIEKFILEKYDLKSKYQLLEAFKNLEKMNFPESIENKIKAAKTCVFDLIEHLDVEHINNISMVKALSDEIIKKHKKFADITKDPAEENSEKK